MYQVALMPRAIKDLKRIPKPRSTQITEKLHSLEDGLKGDIKRLTHHSPEYRLRVGDYRVLFEVEGNKVIVYRIKPRQNAYSGR